MRTNDTFNIITGEIKREYPISSTNKRFCSLNVLKRMKESKGCVIKQQFPSVNHRRLGTAQDSKLYQYSYIPKNYNSVNRQYQNSHAQNATSVKRKHSQPISLMNATKTTFNIISHTIQSNQQPNWQITKKKCPVSKFTDLGRIFAPNYSETYKNEVKFGKSLNMCGNLCEIQRSYGTDKLFRKFK